MSKTQPSDTAFREISDLAFASYALMRGLKVQKATRSHRGQVIEYKFVFLDPGTDEAGNGIWEQLILDFSNSESLKFDDSVRTLKRLCHASSNSGA